jgi:hypothetical protein
MLNDQRNKGTKEHKNEHGNREVDTVVGYLVTKLERKGNTTIWYPYTTITFNSVK